MSVKDELHNLVEELDDGQAAEARAYLRRLSRHHVPQDESADSRLATRMGPLAVSGRVFFDAPRPDLTLLAAQQGVQPVANFDDLIGDFWPADETADEFITAVRKWRREDGCA